MSLIYMESLDYSVSESSLDNPDSEELTGDEVHKQDSYTASFSKRVSTAPARPLTELEEFRRSSDFLLLEDSAQAASQMPVRAGNKFDLDTEEGQRCCKKFLARIESLCSAFKVETASRQYREEFTSAYKVLYQEGSLSYLTEILDSAQERIPHLWVNGEKYVFSNEVLEAGESLYKSFTKLQQKLREVYNKVLEGSSVGKFQQDVRETLKVFDTKWTEFEHLYVLELIVIEADARRFITKAISIEKEILALEDQHHGRVPFDCDAYQDLRKRLVVLIGKINSVANTEGKGRDDLTLDVLLTAEGLQRRLPVNRAIRALATLIRSAFTGIRQLLRKYNENIEVVDPQLKNNPELVKALGEFETNWEKGKVFFLNSKRCNQIVFFSQEMEKLSEKYSCFKEQVECRDAELFLSVPALLILLKLEGKDKDICRHFCPLIDHEHDKVSLLYRKLKRAYNFGKLACSSPEEYYQMFEKAILGIGQDRQSCMLNQFDNFDYSYHKIKSLAIELQRHKPLQWNQFLDVALSS